MFLNGSIKTLHVLELIVLAVAIWMKKYGMRMTLEIYRRSPVSESWSQDGQWFANVKDGNI